MIEDNKENHVTQITDRLLFLDIKLHIKLFLLKCYKNLGWQQVNKTVLKGLLFWAKELIIYRSNKRSFQRKGLG